jgi:hypothetical protein
MKSDRQELSRTVLTDFWDLLEAEIRFVRAQLEEEPLLGKF